MIGISANPWRWGVGIAILVHFSVILVLGLSRHWGYMSSINDLGVFDQAVWGVLHGESLLNTSQFNRQINWLGFHFHPVLFLFAPFYALIPDVTWFTIAQALALSLAAWPIFLLASRVCLSEKAGLLWALAYLVNPFLLNAAAWDFHPVTLAVPFVAIAMLAIEMKHFRLLLLSSLAILMCKEHLGVMVIGFGFLWWIQNKRWKPAIALISLGIAHSVLVLGVIMPAFSPTGGHVMLGEGFGQLNRYSWLGNSLREVFQTLLIHPLFVIETVMLKMGGAIYLALLLMPFLGFALAAPEFLLPGLADLAVNTLSANPMARGIFNYHSVSIIPILTVAAVYGSERISRWQTRFSAKELGGFAIIVSLIGGYYFSPLPLPGAYNVWAPTHFLNLPEPNVTVIRSLLGNTASVSAQANIGAHFSQRREIYRYPHKVGEVDAIVLRLESPTANINNLPDQLIHRRKYLSNMLDSHLQMDRTEYIISIESLLSGKEYGVWLWNNPWLVLARNVANHESRQKIEQKLNRLRKEWQIK